MAEFPDRIKRIFSSAVTNQSGCYAVKLYINGVRREILIDDLLPVIPMSPGPGFKSAFS
jgi:hypothetical protein